LVCSRLLLSVVACALRSSMRCSWRVGSASSWARCRSMSVRSSRSRAVLAVAGGVGFARAAARSGWGSAVVYGRRTPRCCAACLNTGSCAGRLSVGRVERK
jgi:hypothetical protein